MEMIRSAILQSLIECGERFGNGVNQLFRVEYNGIDCVLKLLINPKRFENELFALSEIKALGVPTPELIGCGCIDSTRTYAILTRYAEAQALNSLTENRIPYLKEMGRLLTCLHSINKKYELDRFDIQKLSIGEELMMFINENNIPFDVDKYHHLLLHDKSLNDFVLSHGDFGDWQVLINVDGIVAVCDWENLRYAPPECDLGFCSAFLEIFQPPAEVEAFLSGYSGCYQRCKVELISDYYKLVLAKLWKHQGRYKGYRKGIDAIKLR